MGVLVLKRRLSESIHISMGSAGVGFSLTPIEIRGDGVVLLKERDIPSLTLPRFGNSKGVRVYIRWGIENGKRIVHEQMPSVIVSAKKLTATTVSFAIDAPGTVTIKRDSVKHKGRRPNRRGPRKGVIPRWWRSY